MDEPKCQARPAVSPAEGLAEISRDRRRGAAELARRCLELMAEWAKTLPAGNCDSLKKRLLTESGRLAACRPSMTPIPNLLDRLGQRLRDLPGGDLETCRRAAASAARSVGEESGNAAALAARRAAALIGPDRSIITLSYSSTVLETCRLLGGGNLSVIVAESRPLNEGTRLAETLVNLGMAVTLITDAQIGLAAGEADVALVGADTVLSDGAVINKSGTYLLALAARDQHIPFFVCCESFKKRRPEQGPVTLENMDPSELGAPGLTGLMVRNTYFDLTPARLVTALITEEYDRE